MASAFRAGLALVAAVAGCARPPAVQPYGVLVSDGRTRTLPAAAVAPVDDFLNRHKATLGIFATPAQPVVEGTAPANRASPVTSR